MSSQNFCKAYFNDTPIDGTATGTATVETTVTESGVDRRFHCMVADACIVEAEHMLSGPIISAGTNSPDYDDIISAQQISGLTGIISKLTLSPDRSEIPEGTEIKCKVRTAAIAVPLHSATCTIKLSLLGVDHLY